MENLNNNLEQQEVNNLPSNKNRKMIVSLYVVIIVLIASLAAYILIDLGVGGVTTECSNEECIIGEAISNSDHRYCDLVNNSLWKDNCYFTLAVETKDDSLCKFMSSDSRIMRNCDASAKRGEYVEVDLNNEKVLEELSSEARQKGKIDAVIANLANIRSAAEFYYDASGSYLGACDSENISNSINAVREVIDDEGVYCNDSSNYWVVKTTLPGDTDDYCLDYKGYIGNVSPISWSPSITSCE